MGHLSFQRRWQLALANSFLRPLVEKAFGSRIITRLPVGLDVFADIASTLPAVRLQVFWDVGANVAQSENTIAKQFPDARIFCFEPFPATYEQLRQRVKGRHTQCLQLALADTAGQVEAYSDPEEPSSSVNSIGRDAAQGRFQQAHRLEVSTVDEQLQAADLSHIDYLKVDTEGHDLKVLQGAAKSLAQGKIGFIEVEAAMNPSNTDHVDLQQFRDFLGPYGYSLFGLYEQVHDHVLQKALLRRANAVFVRQSMLGADA